MAELETGERLTPEQIRLVNPRIRLTPRQQLAMRDAFSEVLPPGASVYLYGSRTDRSQGGGDIDLLIHVPGTDFAAELALGATLRGALEARLGERKIDLSFAASIGPDAKPFVRHVLAGAVRLYP